MSGLLRTATPDELAQKCGLCMRRSGKQCVSDEGEPAPWGIAEAIPPQNCFYRPRKQGIPNLREDR